MNNYYVLASDYVDSYNNLHTAGTIFKQTDDFYTNETNGGIIPAGEAEGNPDEFVEMTDAQRRWMENRDNTDEECKFRTILTLLGRIKQWEHKIDAIMENPDDQEALGDLQNISSDMCGINM